MWLLHLFTVTYSKWMLIVVEPAPSHTCLDNLYSNYLFKSQFSLRVLNIFFILCPPDLIHCTNELNVSIPHLADTLLERTASNSWIVVFKALITTHHLMMYGNEVSWTHQRMEARRGQRWLFSFFILVMSSWHNMPLLMSSKKRRRRFSLIFVEVTKEVNTIKNN